MKRFDEKKHSCSTRRAVCVCNWRDSGSEATGFQNPIFLKFEKKTLLSAKGLSHLWIWIMISWKNYHRGAENGVRTWRKMAKTLIFRWFFVFRSNLRHVPAHCAIFCHNKSCRGDKDEYRAKKTSDVTGPVFE